MRRDLHKLVRLLVAVPGIRDVGLTTNGILLADQAQALFDAGLRRLNVSLDTLDPGRFRELTRRDGLEKVLAGLDAAKRAGFDPIKVNAVAIRGVHRARRGAAGPLLPRARLRAAVHRVHADRRGGVGARQGLLRPRDPRTARARGRRRSSRPNSRPDAPRRWTIDYADGGGRVGIIASVSRPFCQHCNRLRLTADGKLRNCLFALDEADVKALLRAGRPTTKRSRRRSAATCGRSGRGTRSTRRGS